MRKAERLRAGAVGQALDAGAANELALARKAVAQILERLDAHRSRFGRCCRRKRQSRHTRGLEHALRPGTQPPDTLFDDLHDGERKRLPQRPGAPPRMPAVNRPDREAMLVQMLENPLHEQWIA